MARGLRRTRLVALAAVVGLGLDRLRRRRHQGDHRRQRAAATAGTCGSRSTRGPATSPTPTSSGYVAKEKLGCNVTYPEVKEEVGWQGMADGSIDTIVENWGHPDLVKKYIDEQGSVEDAGLTGNDGIIGWYVPPWMAEKYPDITDWKNLNKYADTVQDLRVRRQGPAARRRPVLRHQRRGAGQEPRPRLQGRRRRQRGGADPELPVGRGEQDAAAGLLLRAAVVLRRR